MRTFGLFVVLFMSSVAASAGDIQASSDCGDQLMLDIQDESLRDTATGISEVLAARLVISPAVPDSATLSFSGSGKAAALLQSVFRDFNLMVLEEESEACPGRYRISQIILLGAGEAADPGMFQLEPEFAELVVIPTQKNNGDDKNSPQKGRGRHKPGHEMSPEEKYLYRLNKRENKRLGRSENQPENQPVP